MQDGASLATFSQDEIYISILKRVASMLLPIVRDSMRVKVNKSSWLEGCILGKLITRELIIKAGRISHSIRDQQNMVG